MGFFDSLTGSGVAKAATGAANQYSSALDSANQRGQSTLGQGNAANAWRGDQAIDVYKGGAESATRHLSDQFGNAINTTFETGKNALDAYSQGRTSSIDAIRQGFGYGREAIQTGMDKASGYFDPYMQTGKQYNAMLANALGANGQPAQSDFYANYANNDPFRAENEQLANQSIMRAMNAQGLGGSGREGLAVSRASLERGSQDMNRYLDRLQAGSDRGGQYAGQLGAIQMQGAQGIGQLYAGQANAEDSAQRFYGGNIANTWQSTGNSAANLATQLGMAQANNANQLGNNLGATYRGLGAADMQTAGSQAQLDYASSQAIAKAQADAALAAAKAKQDGAGNILKMGTAVAQMAMGMPPTSMTGGGGGDANQMLQFNRTVGTPNANAQPWVNPDNPYASLGGAYGGGF